MKLRKPIKVVEENRDAIDAALREVNGGSRAFTVSGYGQVAGIAKRATARLDFKEVRVSDRRGATVVHRPAGPLAKAYGKRPVVSTIVVLNLMSDGRTWRLAEVSNDEVWAKTPERHKVYLSADGQRSYLADRIGDFDVRQTPEEIETERQRQFMADTEARLRREAEEAEAAAARVEKGEMDDLAQFAA